MTLGSIDLKKAEYGGIHGIARWVVREKEGNLRPKIIS